MNPNKDEIVLRYGDNLIRESDLNLLNPGEWLNDNIISFWFTYLQNHLISDSNSYCCVCPEMSQFFKSAQQSHDMYEELDKILADGLYANKDIFFIPINDCDFKEYGGNHWSLLVFYHRIYPNHSRAEHFDSSASSNIYWARIVANILNKILNCGKQQQIDVIERNCIKQINNYDCGIHLLCNVEALIHILILNENKSLKELTSLTIIKNKREEIKKKILDLKIKNA